MEQKGRTLAKITADIRDTGVKNYMIVGRGDVGQAGQLGHV